MVDLTQDSDDDSIFARQQKQSRNFPQEPTKPIHNKHANKKRKQIRITFSPSKRPAKKQKLDNEDSISQKEIDQLQEKLLIAERQRDEARKTLKAERSNNVQSKN
eukprot:UN23696